MLPQRTHVATTRRVQTVAAPRSKISVAATSSRDELSGLEEFLNHYDIGEKLHLVCAAANLLVCLLCFFLELLLLIALFFIV